MRSDEVIRSRANPIIKRIGSIRAGLEPGTVLLEGDRLVDDALRAGVVLECVLVADDRDDRAEELAKGGTRVQRIEADLLHRASGLKTSPGTLALCPTPASIEVAKLSLDESALVLVACGIADPGNLGALARSAEAFGASALLVTRGGASPWNEKALRGSMGSLLRVRVGHGLDAEALAADLRARNVRQVCAATRGGTDPRKFDWRGPIALWIGSETGELPDAARDFEQVTIPMASGIESLNVTVAASLLLWSSGRVREGDPRIPAGKQRGSTGGSARRGAAGGSKEHGGA